MKINNFQLTSVMDKTPDGKPIIGFYMTINDVTFHCLNYFSGEETELYLIEGLLRPVISTLVKNCYSLLNKNEDKP